MNLHYPTPETKSDIHLAELSLFQQMLLVTDGTLTKMLETYAHEVIQVVKLAETNRPIQPEIDALELTTGDTVIERKILLQGCQSQHNWLYAESLLVPQRLPPSFQEQLLTTREPIGKLWLTHKIETFKEIIITYRQSAGPIATYFNLNPFDQLLCRTYRVLSNRLPIMMITEKFPDSYFRNGM